MGTRQALDYRDWEWNHRQNKLSAFKVNFTTQARERGNRKMLTGKSW